MLVLQLMTLVCTLPVQATPVIAGLAIGAAAYAGKAAIELAVKFRNAPPRLRQFYKVSCTHIAMPSTCEKVNLSSVWRVKS